MIAVLDYGIGNLRSAEKALQHVGARAKLVTDAVKVNPKSEQELLHGAEGDSVGQLRERCQRAKAEGRSKEQADAHHRRLHERRRCWTFTDDDGASTSAVIATPSRC